MAHVQKAYSNDILAKLNPPTLPVERRFEGRHTNHTALAYITACLLSLVGCVGMIWGMASVNWVIAVAGGWLVVVLYAGGLMILAEALKWQEK